MAKPLISVISIIYQVEPYLKECLDSLMSLSYPALELILVIGLKEEKDDGCLKMAEEYAEKDKRFKIITCRAAGVSDARNRGLDAARGDYIGFVDGDDYVDSDMYDRLFYNISSYGADIAVCGKYSEYPDGTRTEENAYTAEPELLSSEAAVRMLITGGGFFFHCWDKLFRADLFDGMRFPEDKYLEDRYTVGDIILKAEKIVYDRKPSYHFRVRTDSVSHHEQMSEMNAEADAYFAERALRRYPALADELEAYLLYGHITCIQNALISGHFDRDKEEKHFDYIRSHRKSAFDNRSVGLNTRVKVILSLYSLPLLKLLTLRGKGRQDRLKGFTKA